LGIDELLREFVAQVSDNFVPSRFRIVVLGRCVFVKAVAIVIEASVEMSTIPASRAAPLTLPEAS